MTLATAELTRQYDKTQARVFRGKNSAFLGSLMCSVEFGWKLDVPTACTDGAHLWWNPDWFLSIPEDTRETVLVHEMYHLGYMHHIRRGDRDPSIWGKACDMRINNDLMREGYTFTGTTPILNPSIDDNGILPEEAIYDLMLSNKIKTPSGGTWGEPGGDTDLTVPEQETPAHHQKIIETVARAVQQAKFLKKAGDIPGCVEEMINTFLTPVVPWEQHLHQFFTDLQDEDYTWARPNRRHADIYLPSRYMDQGRLEHLMYFLDVSGSISTEQEIRFNSELKYIQETIKPAKLTVVQFDTIIQQVRVFNDGEQYDSMEIIGRGGTCLVCVRDYIIEHKPTCAVIFSDMECAQMEPLPFEIPTLWAVLGNPRAKVKFGKMIHIPE